MSKGTRRRWGVGAVLTAALALATVVLGSPASAATPLTSTPAASAAAAPAAVIADGIVRWHNLNSAQCLTYAAGSKGAAFQEGCDDPNFSGAISEWYAKNVGGNNYTFVNEANGQCLSISGSSTADGAAAFVWTCTAGLTAQIFTLVPVAAGGPDAYELVNINSNKCVSVGGAKKNAGAWVIQWTCYGGAEQLWRPY